jgi:hypothetical protein
MYDVASELKIRREDFPEDLDEMEVCTIREQFVSAKWNYPGEEHARVWAQAVGNIQALAEAEHRV